VRQDTGNAAPIAANEDALRPSVVDRRPVAAAAPVEPGTERHEANVPELTAAIWAPTPGPPRESRLADSQRRNVSAPVSDAGFVGSWTDDVGKCRNGRKAPIVISSRTAKTAIGGCDFGLVTREAANRWRVTARCALEGKVWRANIALKLTEPNLTWSSERGTTTYVRCGR
jgi:hypothetical protein